MTDPISPPPEFVKQCMSEFNGSLTWPGELALHTAARAAQWGYDQRGEVNEAKLQQARDEELEACCEVLGRELICDGKHVARDLRIIRRPKPSLKEQALEDLHWLVGHTLGRKDGNSSEFDERSNRILSALEALPDD